MREHSIDRLDCWDAGCGSAFDHDDVDAKVARGFDFGVGRLAAAVLGHDHIDLFVEKQGRLARDVEGTCRKNVARLRNVERRFDGINASDHIGMLGRDIEAMCLLPADRQEYPARSLTERSGGFRYGGDGMPAIAIQSGPWRAPKCDRRDTGSTGCGSRVGGNGIGEGVSRVDQQIDLLRGKVVREAIAAAETADTGRQGLRLRISGSPGKREDGIDIASLRKGFGKTAGFRRSPQDQDAGFGHA